MVCYNTCSSPGCYERIPYEKGEKPEKYCGKHLPDRDTRSNLIPSITPNPEPESFVVMKCPSCKTTEVILKSEWLLKPTVACTHCIGVMIYHKDANVKTLHDKASIQNDSIGWN